MIIYMNKVRTAGLNQGYQGTQADYSELINYASKVYKLTSDASPNPTKVIITHADQEVPWLKDLRERISKVLSEYLLLRLKFQTRR